MNNWTKRWDERYKAEEFAYGEEPNNYLEEQLDKSPPSNILFAAEGEGRNAVYAARHGWKVTAFDISEEGKRKAMLLAEKNKVTIDYIVGELPNLNFAPGQFDVLALIYAHFPPEIKSEYHLLLKSFLKKGGTVIFEAFSKQHLNYLEKDETMGGPRDIDMLFSTEELQNYFSDFDIVELKEKEIELHEGAFHNGKGSVIRFVGRKK